MSRHTLLSPLTSVGVSFVTCDWQHKTGYLGPDSGASTGGSVNVVEREVGSWDGHQIKIQLSK